MNNTHQPLLHRPQGTDLGNWRERPYSAWAFQNVRELLPTANIRSAGTKPKDDDCANIEPEDAESLVRKLEDSQTDSMVILKEGRKQWQWCAAHCDISRPHIVFSVSKSITAMMTGVLVGQGLIDPKKSVHHYLPGTKGSAYEDCAVQHVLDMSVSLDFTEDYLNPGGDYFRYRNATGWNPVDQINPPTGLEPFLYGIGKAGFEHGDIFNYKSPNSDLLGLLLERVSGVYYADLLSELIWQPMGAATDGYVTVDRAMLGRGAGGICTTVDDLARFGQLVLDHGAIGTRSIIPESWIVDTKTQGDRNAWLKGDFVKLLPRGNYRNKWYQVGNEDQCIMGLGIHGQWLYLNPETRVVIAKLSSQGQPLDDATDTANLGMMESLSQAY